MSSARRHQLGDQMRMRKHGAVTLQVWNICTYILFTILTLGVALFCACARQISVFNGARWCSRYNRRYRMYSNLVKRSTIKRTDSWIQYDWVRSDYLRTAAIECFVYADNNIENPSSVWPIRDNNQMGRHSPATTLYTTTPSQQGRDSSVTQLLQTVDSTTSSLGSFPQKKRREKSLWAQIWFLRLFRSPKLTTA